MKSYFAYLSRKAIALLDLSAKMKSGWLVGVPTKPKEEIRKSENFALGFRNGAWNVILHIYPEKLSHFQI
jgi:hypothetical protein